MTNGGKAHTFYLMCLSFTILIGLSLLACTFTTQLSAFKLWKFIASRKQHKNLKIVIFSVFFTSIVTVLNWSELEPLQRILYPLWILAMCLPIF